MSVLCDFISIYHLLLGKILSYAMLQLAFCKHVLIILIFEAKDIESVWWSSSSLIY